MLEAFNVLPTAVLGLITVGATVFCAVSGMAFFRKFVRSKLRLSEAMNNDVIFYASAINAFYGLTVGLIAVGVWRNYNTVQDIVSQEASIIASLYRDISSYPEPWRSSLQQELRDYTKTVVEKAWPAQRQGILLDDGTIMLTEFQKKLYLFEPKTNGQQILHSEAMKQFNTMCALRRQRIEGVKGGLPSVMWAVVIVGAILSISVTYLLEIEEKTHYILVAYLSTLTGLVIFVTYGLDHPLSGPVAIEPTAYRMVLDKHIAIVTEETATK